MSFTNLKIVRIVSRSNLNNTSSEFLINIAVCDNRYLSICKWKVYFLSNKICISFIIRINSKCRITKKCLWTSSSYLYISSFFTNYRIIDMPEMSCLLSCSTSASDIDVLHTGHQFTILEPLYIRPFSYNLQNTSRTALEQPSSIVNLSLSQSQDEPIFFNWLVMVPPYSFFHSHVLLRKPSLPSSCLSIPSSFKALVTFTSVEILAWSVP